jgi:hypothetical protein
MHEKCIKKSYIPIQYIFNDTMSAKNICKGKKSCKNYKYYFPYQKISFSFF